MRQLWIFVVLAVIGSSMSSGQQIPPPPPPASQTTQTSPPPEPSGPQSSQPAQTTTVPAQQPATTTAPAQQTTTAPVAPSQQPAQTTTAPAAQPTTTAPAQQPATTTAPAQQTTTAPVAPSQQPAQTTTAPATQPTTTAPAQQPATTTAPAQQTTTAPVAPSQQPAQTTTAPAAQPTAPVQQPATPTAPAQQTTAPAQQPTEPTVPQVPSPAAAPAAPQDVNQKANERWQLEQEAARQGAIAQAEEDAQAAQQKADKLKLDIDKKQKQAQIEQAKANEAKQKARNLQSGAPLPQSDQPEMTEAEFKREYIRAREKSLDRLRDSESVLRSFTTGKVNISADLLRKARCVVILPSTKKAAFVVGADYARGVMSCRLGENFDGPWSPPNMVALEGGSFGPQIGIQGTDWVLLIMNERGVDSLLKSKSKLGGDASIAAGPWGRAVQASTDTAMRAEILSFSHAHGIFIGADLIGSSLRPDGDANYGLYGRNYEPRDIVRSGEIRIPPEAVSLTNALQAASNRPPETKTQDSNKPPGGGKQ